MITAVMIYAGKPTEDRCALWCASCQWSGVTFEAKSRSGASYALCRELVTASAPDMPMAVISENGRPMLHIGSIHKTAKRTIRENSQTLIHEARYESFPDGNSAVSGEAQNAVKTGEGYIGPGWEPKRASGATC